MTQSTHALLDRLVRMQALAQAVLDELARLNATGQVGTVAAAGDAMAAIVGAAMGLEPGDLLFGTTRDLPAALVRGVTVESVMDQCVGTAADAGLGRGMPGAINDPTAGVALSDGSPAAHLVHAAGFGHAARLQHADHVALGLFGSGAVANGEVHAAFNFAAVNRSQVVFVARGPLGDELPLLQSAPAWGLAAVQVQGDDGAAVCDAVREARARACSGDGPTVIDARVVGAAQPVDSRALTTAGGPLGSTRAVLDEEARQAVVSASRAALDAGRPAIATMLEHVLAPNWTHQADGMARR